MKKINKPEEFLKEILSLGEVIYPSLPWTEDGRLLGDAEASTRYFESLPKALFECECDSRHHMVQPKMISSDWITDSSRTLVRTAKFKFDVLIYGHYETQNFFTGTTQHFLVKCKSNNISLVSCPPRFFTSSNNNGIVRVRTTEKCLSALIDYHQNRPLDKANVSSIYGPFGYHLDT